MQTYIYACVIITCAYSTKHACMRWRARVRACSRAQCMHVTDKLAGSLHFHRSLLLVARDEDDVRLQGRVMMHDVMMTRLTKVARAAFHLHTQDTGPDPAVLHGVRVRLVYGLERVRARTTP